MLTFIHKKLLIQLSFFEWVCNAVFLTDAVGRFIVTQKNQRCFMTFLRSRNTADTVFLFSYRRNLFSPLIPPSECHCNMDVLDRQGECYNFVIIYYIVRISQINLHTLRFYRIIASHQYPRTCI